MSDATIEVTGLRKRFGAVLALDGMSFSVRPGEVTGFIGPNGAGKSTTMRVILGLDAVEAGSALVGGQRAAGRTRSCGIRSASWARCWTRPRCSPAGRPATTCCGWPVPRAWADGGWTR
jgi:ABC-type branched-subunit amino acid transport system ATPase component